MANIAALLQALSALPQTQGGPLLLPPIGGTTPPFIPTPINAGDFNPPQSAQFPVPEPPPAAPAAPLNLDLIRQYVQFAGAPPVQPVQKPASTLDKIVAVLGGIG